MFSKAKVYLVALAAIALAVPAGLLTADAPAGASTAACGSACTSPSVLSLGTGQELTVSGSTVEMAAASSSNTGQDWTPEFYGQVSTAVQEGILPNRLMLNYSAGSLFELQYAPAGLPSNKCLADSYTGSSILDEDPPFNDPNLSVVLAQCGITLATLWIVDPNINDNGYSDLINAGYQSTYSYGAENNDVDVPNLATPFAEPAVLTVNSSDQVVLAYLSEIGGVVSSSQLWTSWTSPAQAAVRKAIQAAHRKAVAARFG
jgi:hypothetical protein